MTIPDAKQKKAELEAYIEHLVAKFEEETECKISCVYLQRQDEIKQPLLDGKFAILHPASINILIDVKL
jgi:hypothetical protein